jgi:hypothetical protein
VREKRKKRREETAVVDASRHSHSEREELQPDGDGEELQ